ncbi:MAG: glycosyltransferase 87 family protein [Solirubrobacteraceae bacterium]
MTSRRAALAVPLALLGTLALALTTGIGLDYYADAAPGIKALAAGDLHRWAAEQPQMGQLSILLRAPVAALGLGELWSYRLGALVLLVAPLMLANALRPSTRAARVDPVLIALVVCLNPMTLRALVQGHPEEPLGGALCALALLCALDGRARWSGLALGLALGTKQWALFAVLPVLFACRSRAQWQQVLVVAVPVAALLTVPPVLLDPGAFSASMGRPIAGLAILRPGNLWSLLVPSRQFADIGGEVVGLSLVPSWLRALAHPLIIGVAFALALLWRRRREASRPETAMALLAVVFLARCLLDPWNHGYYHWPFLAALVCWEVRGLGRVPVMTAVSSAALWVVFTRFDGLVMDFAYVTWAVVSMVVLVREAYGPLRLPELRRGVAARAT